MQTLQKKQTLLRILRYIKTHARNNILRESMASIATQTGVSNATVHRALKQLEAQEMIQIIPSKSRRKPYTICYIGPNEEEMCSVVEKARVAVEHLRRASSEVHNILEELEDSIALYDDMIASHDYIELQS